MGKIANQVAKTAEKQMEPAKQSVNQLMATMLDSEKMRARFDELLGKRAPQFISALISAINGSNELQRAFFESPMTVIVAGLKAAAFDLPIEPSLGYAYIVPFKNTHKDEKGQFYKKMEATFILGWKGMNQLALRTGQYKVINVVDVREGELKSYNRLTEEITLDFIEDEDQREAAPIIGYVGYFRLVNGAEKTIYMTLKQIDAHERKFRKGEYRNSNWNKHYEDMCRKTVFRRLIGKYGVMSIDYQKPAAQETIGETFANEFSDSPVPALDPDIPSVDEETGEVIDAADGSQETLEGI